MMRSRLARLLIIFAALWLPLQAVASIIMPACRHADQQVAHEAAAPHCAHAGHAAAGAASHDHAGNVAADGAIGHACHACGFCHLAGAAALPAAIVTSVALPPARVYAVPAEQPLVSYIPEQPQRPPRLPA